MTEGHKEPLTQGEIDSFMGVYESYLNRVLEDIESSPIHQTLDKYLTSLVASAEEDDELSLKEDFLELLDEYMDCRINDVGEKQKEAINRWCSHNLPDLVALCDKSPESPLFYFIKKATLDILYHGLTKLPQQHQGLVYFIMNPQGRVKIGFTRDIHQRLTTLNTSAGGGLIVLYSYSPIVKSPSGLECLLHRHYTKHRKIGEWFDIPVNEVEWRALCLQYDI